MSTVSDTMTQLNSQKRNEACVGNANKSEIESKHGGASNPVVNALRMRMKAQKKHAAELVGYLDKQISVLKSTILSKDKQIDKLKLEKKTMGEEKVLKSALALFEKSLEIDHYRRVVSRDERLAEWKKQVGWLSDDEFEVKWVTLFGPNYPFGKPRNYDEAMALKQKYDNQPKIPEHLVERIIVGADEMEESNYKDDASINRCMECNIDMGDCNPRQLCGKTHCDNATSDDEDTEGLVYHSEGDPMTVKPIVQPAGPTPLFDPITGKRLGAAKTPTPVARVHW